MSSNDERICSVCGNVEPPERLSRCDICRKMYCDDCGYRAYGGRRFCSEPCGRAYYFQGEDDDDKESRFDDDEQ